MRLKTDLKRIKKLSIELGNLMDKRNSKVCSDCKFAYYRSEDSDLLVNIKTVSEARKFGRIESKEAGCCSSCQDYYWKRLDENNEKQLNKLKRIYKYDEYYHFFDTDKKSCRLPRQYRSVVCLEWGLSCIFKTEEEELRNKVHRICGIINQLRKRNNLLC